MIEVTTIRFQPDRIQLQAFDEVGQRCGFIQILMIECGSGLKIVLDKIESFKPRLGIGTTLMDALLNYILELVSNSNYTDIELLFEPESQAIDFYKKYESRRSIQFNINWSPDRNIFPHDVKYIYTLNAKLLINTEL